MNCTLSAALRISVSISCPYRHEQVENAKREMRKEQALKKAYKTRTDGEAGSSSSDDDIDPDEDKLAEEEEAGMQECLCSHIISFSECMSSLPPLWLRLHSGRLLVA